MFGVLLVEEHLVQSAPLLRTEGVPLWCPLPYGTSGLSVLSPSRPVQQLAALPMGSPRATNCQTEEFVPPSCVTLRSARVPVVNVLVQF